MKKMNNQKVNPTHLNDRKLFIVLQKNKNTKHK